MFSRSQIFIFFLLLVIILFRYFSLKPTYKNGDRVRITDQVLSEPISYSNKQLITLSGLSFYLPLFPEINYGDRVVVEGVVEDAKLKNPKLVSLDTDRGVVFNFRKKLIDFYKQSLPEPYSSLVAGMTIGSKNMPSEFWEKLKNTGTAHVVVASGTNVSLVSGFLMLILVKFIKRRLVVPIVVVFIVLYVLLSGFDPPIVRAAIMGSITLFLLYNGRPGETTAILIYTALIMLVINPFWLSDIGFILSFVATLSLVLFQKKVNKKLSFVPGFFREDLSTSLSAQIGVSPIIFVVFGQFNILSPIINALILWTVTPIMISGIVAGVVGYFVPLVGRLILLATYVFCFWFVKVVEFFG